MDRSEFIDNNAALFWYIPKDQLHQISDEVLTEFIMNYGTMEAVKGLFEVVGKNKLLEIFNNLEGRKKLNYFPEIYNYFGLLVKHNA